jgi:hypothetical protein
MTTNKKNFLEVLEKISIIDSKIKPKDLEMITTEFRNAMISYGSATPDNIDASEKLSIKSFRGIGCDYDSVGICLAKDNISIGDILYAVEGSEIPDFIKEKYPNLSYQEWVAIFRVVVLILGIFES